ncbi:hypothetical protein SAMN06295970_101608 [Noviherbaspirillum suwonense]|jgi:hypothetical protein|uniref:Lipoprotein n=2 Tax=Noviherbaspirillum suwonense TaxID=1224511 RepID=A0ABY1PTG2_9BURK|nr:hypothetical protein SAMN06295970_101608 [Noviherbaspirillum suwonense]
MGWRADRSASIVWLHPVRWHAALRLLANIGKTMLKTNYLLSGCLMLGILATLPACGRKDAVATPTAVSQPGAATVESKGVSVAAPPSEMPKQDAAIPPQSPTVAATVPDSASPSQANPKTLDKEQESTAMPMPGQVNNHSTPESIDKPGAQPK